MDRNNLRRKLRFISAGIFSDLSACLFIFAAVTLALSGTQRALAQSSSSRPNNPLQNFSSFQATVSALGGFSDGDKFAAESSTAGIHYERILQRFVGTGMVRSLYFAGLGHVSLAKVTMHVDGDKREGAMYAIAGGLQASFTLSAGLIIGVQASVTPWSSLAIAGHHVMNVNGDDVERATLTQYDNALGRSLGLYVSNDYLTSYRKIGFGLVSSWDYISWSQRKQRQVISDGSLVPQGSKGTFGGQAVLSTLSIGPFIGYLF